MISRHGLGRVSSSDAGWLFAAGTAWGDGSSVLVNDSGTSKWHGESQNERQRELGGSAQNPENARNCCSSCLCVLARMGKSSREGWERGPTGVHREWDRPTR